MDGFAPLLPAAVDPAMASATSLASFDEDGSRRPSSSSLVARSSRMSNTTRQKSVQQVLHPYKFDGQMAGPLRRKATTAPTAWPRDPSTLTTTVTTGKSNRDSLEMSLDPWKMDTTKNTLAERRPHRKRESQVQACTVTIPFNANSFDSPTERPTGEAQSPFILPNNNNATVTPTKPATAPSFFTAMFSKNSTGPAIPRTPSSNSPNRPSTVRRIARTLLEWNLGPETDLTKWQRDSPRTPRTPRTPREANRTSASDEILSEDSPMRSPD